MRFSRGGLILAGCYLAIATALLVTRGLAGDDKGAFVLGQFAVLPGILLLSALGLGNLLLNTPWLNSYTVMVLLNLSLAYAIGWAASRVHLVRTVGIFVRERMWAAITVVAALALLTLVPPHVPLFALIIGGGVALVIGAVIWDRSSRPRRD